MHRVLLGIGLSWCSAGLLASQTASTLSPTVKKYVTVDDPVVALTHVRIIDGTAGPILEDQTVVLANGAIQSVGPAASAKVPAGARVMDLAGHTVIPGLVGLHDHMLYTTRNRMVEISASASKLYLATGITTVRTTGALEPYDEITRKALIERGEWPGPRMHITGPHISGGKPLQFGPEMTVTTIRYVKTPEEARRAVAYWGSEGADWIKVYTGITRDQLRAVVDEAHKQKMGVTGHLCSITFREAAELGMDNVEHGLPTDTEFHPKKQLDLCPADGTEGQAELDMSGTRVQAAIKFLIDKGVAMTSTLCVFEPSVPNRPPIEERVFDAMAPDVRQEVLSSRKEIAALPVERPAKLFKQAMAYELAFYRAGGVLAAGSDPTGYGTILPGFGDQRNYELLREAGFTPAQAIQVMSANGAKVLHVADKLGTVTAGKLADLVVIRGNPVTTASDIKNVTVVFKDGVGYDSAKLIESVKGLVGIR